MRILFAADVPPDPNSGAAGTEFQTIAALRRLGCHVDAIWAGDLGRRIQHGNLHYLLELPRRYREVIAERCRRADYDVLHVNQGHCYLAAKDHAGLGRKGFFVCRSHGLDDHLELVLRSWRRALGIEGDMAARRIASRVLSGLLARHDKLAYRYADGIIVSSSLDRDYLLHTMSVPEARVACVPQAPGPSFLATPAPPMTLSRIRRILHVGGFAYWKGTHSLVAAIDAVLAADETVEVTWVCKAEDHPRVRELLAERSHARVQLHDWMSQSELVSVLDRHGIFICPSLFEGFNKVFLEAMSRGLCVVGTPTGGMRDILRSHQNGILVNFNDPVAITQAVQSLLDRPQLASSISSTAAVNAREYSWDRVARETLDFYGRLQDLGRRRH